MYNSVAKQTSKAYNTRSTEDILRAGLSIVMWFVLTGALEELIRHTIATDKEKDKDKRSIFARIVQSSIGNAAGTIPLVRDFSQVALKQIFEGNTFGTQMRPSLGLTVFTNALTAVETATKLGATNKKDSIDFGRELNQVFNAMYGVPNTLTDALWTTLRVLERGDIDFAEYLHAVIFDKKIKSK